MLKNRLAKYYFLSIIFLNLSFHSFSFAQKNNIRFQNISTENGLSNNTVNSVIQDSEGYMWFATNDGLNKYDANKLTIYRYEKDKPNSLPANRVRFLFLDSKKRIWFGSSNGLSIYNKEDDNFINYLNGKYIRSVSEDREGNLWLASRYGLIKFDPETKDEIIYPIKPKNSLSKTYNILCTAVDYYGNIWAGTDGSGVYSFNPVSKKFTVYKNIASQNSLAENIVLTIFEDSKQRLWIGTKNGLNKFDRIKNRFIPFDKKGYNLGSYLIFSIIEDAEGYLWIGSYEGISKFNPDSKEIINYSHQENNPYSLSSNLVRCIYRTDKNIFWIGTRNGGINKYDANSSAFILYDKYFSCNGSKLSSNSVTSIYEDSKENIWIGTIDAGLNEYNRNDKSYKNYKHNPNNPSSLSQNNILSLLVDSNDDIWVGTYGGGLDKFDKETETFKHFKHDPQNRKSISSNIIQNLFEDSDNNIWVCTDGGGINKFDKTSETFIRYLFNPNDTNSISSNTVLVAYEDSKKNIWFGTSDGGLNKFEAETGKFHRYLNSSTASGNKFHIQIFSIAENSKDALWLGSGNGLIYFNYKKNILKKYTAKDGLPSNIVFGILSDANNNLWVSTNRGLTRFTISNSMINNFDVGDGLQGNIFGINSYHKGKSGRFYFGGTNGFNEFYPSNIQIDTKPPKIVFTDFYVFDKRITVLDSTFLQKSLGLTKHISLNYTDYIFSFVYAALNFSNSSKIEIMHKLDGFDKDWVFDNAGIKKATYTNIPPGEYIFKVKARKNNGSWSENAASIEITIRPPFWKTIWFYAILFFFFSFIFYSAFRFRINQLLKVERLRVKLASDLHDDIGATLSKISMQAEIIKEGIEPENNKKNLSRISTLSRNAIDSMRDIVWAIDSRNDSFEKMLSKMKDETYNLLGSKNINVNFVISDIDLQKKMPVMIRQNLYLILKEGVNNIFKHSNAKNVEIFLSQTNSRLKLEIHDDGDEIEIKSYSSGQGISNIKMRAEQIGGTFSYNIDNGFTIIVENVKF